MRRRRETVKVLRREEEGGEDGVLRKSEKRIGRREKEAGWCQRRDSKMELQASNQARTQINEYQNYGQTR